MHHLIKTQIIEVTTDNSAGSFDLQQKLSSVYYSVLLPLMEKTFDQLAPAGRTIYLDRLCVELGTLSIESLDRNNWTIEFAQLLARELREVLLEQSINYKSKTTIAGTAGQWLFYMQHGFLPWNVTDTNKEWYDKVLEELATNYHSIESLRRLIIGNEKAVRRIVLEHSPVFLVHLAEALTGKKQDALLVLINIIEKSLTLSGQPGMAVSSPAAGRNLWQRVFLYCASAPGAGTQDIIVNALLRNLDKTELKQLIKLQRSEPLLRSYLPLIRNQQAKQELENSNEVQHKQEQKQSADEQHSVLSQDGIFVKHAGLVLLHPFLASFFRSLQLIREGKFITLSSQLKALSLLHFIATGIKQSEEHELVLPKLLCGYPLEEPVDRQMLAAAEMEEAEQLLQAVIGQWSILKNTSVDALRESFLQRKGKLIAASGDSYRLIVEPDSLDVLLDHIPWPLSMVRLPWMNQMLKVDWR